MFKALFYAYLLGGLTFIPLVVGIAIFITIYTSVPVGDPDVAKKRRGTLERQSAEKRKEQDSAEAETDDDSTPLELNDKPVNRRGWLTIRRTFEEVEGDVSYVDLVRGFLDSRSKDTKRSRPKDMWYAVVKSNILYLYEDEQMSECDAVIELSGHDVLIYPEGIPDAEVYAKRNAICLRRKVPQVSLNLPSLTKEMKYVQEPTEDANVLQKGALQSESPQKTVDAARDEAFAAETPWFIFVRSGVEMEDWYFSLLHASSHPAQTPTLQPLRAVFDPKDMNHLVQTLDAQPDVIPMRWFNALLGRIFFSHYRTDNLEAFIIGRLMKKLEKVKRPQFLTDIAVTEVSVGTTPPMLSKPMLKELTKEGDAAIEVHFHYKGEFRITIEATAVINLGSRFKPYNVKLVLAAVLKELEGNLLIKVKRAPSNRIWYAFTTTPRMVLVVEPIVSDRQITWSMILGVIESQIKDIIQETIVMPNMDDIAYFDSMPYHNRGGIWADAARHLHPQPFVTPPTADETRGNDSVPIVIATAASQSDDMLAVNAIPGDTKPSGEVSDSERKKIKRKKSWFSNNRSDGNLSADVFEDSRRGRRGSPESRENSSGEEERSRSRSHSRRGSISSNRSTKSNQSSLYAPSQRSSSRFSNRDGQSDAETSSRKGRAPSRRQSDMSQKSRRSPSPPSFFSTLKSKAGDKQALSNTAKETMRKWGVNWGMKKEANVSTSSGSGGEDSHDVSFGYSARNSTGLPPGHRPRASYAEVRAAVAGRKSESNGDMSFSTLPVTEPTGQSQAPLVSISAPTASSTARNAAHRLTSKKSSPSISLINTDIDAEVTPDSPIHVQPQAKTMSIPGIHAKHRGEIQSMGYVVPSPPPVAKTPSAASAMVDTVESKIVANPTIQTVYRFLKNPSLVNRDNTSTNVNSSANAGVTQSGASEGVRGGETTQIVPDDQQSVSAVSVEGIERGTPPPLPPRSAPDAAASPPSTNIVASPASEALKNIVSKDENLRCKSPQELVDTGDAYANVDATTSVPALQQNVAEEPSDGRGALNASPVEGTPGDAPSAATGTFLGLGAPPPLPPRRITTIAS